MMNNNLIPYKENIFTKISKYFQKIFSKKIANKETKLEFNQIKNNFLENIKIPEDTELNRLKKLQLQYDNGDIEEDDISEEDIEKICEMYEKETEELNADTEKRKIHIAYMLKELKNF